MYKRGQCWGLICRIGQYQLLGTFWKWIHTIHVCYFTHTDMTLSLPYLHAAWAQPYSQHHSSEGGQKSEDPAANCLQYLTSCQSSSLAQNTHTHTGANTHTQLHLFHGKETHCPVTFCPCLHILEVRDSSHQQSKDGRSHWHWRWYIISHFPSSKLVVNNSR